MKKIYLGNLYSKRDWGYAKDFIKAQWMIVQQKKPDDFVIATGKQYTIKQFISYVAKELNLKIRWKGKGLNEKGFDENGNIIIEIDKTYFRPSEVNKLLGDYTKAKKILGWYPETNIRTLVKNMVSADMKLLN
jgi:GDPmannose 4,6-dehydratase